VREEPKLQDRVWDDLIGLRARRPGTPDALRAARLLARLPSPLDTLRPQKIMEGLPRDVVAVLEEPPGAFGRITALSSDGRSLALLLASSTELGNTAERIGVWKFGGAAPARELVFPIHEPNDNGPHNGVGLAFSPDGKTLALITIQSTVLL